MAPKGLMSPETGEEDEMAETPAGEMSEGGEGERASPEEQRQFDSLLKPIYDLLHGNGSQQTLDRLKAGKADMANTIGEIAAQTLTIIEEKVTGGGGQIADSVKLQVVMEIVEELIEIADSAGLIQGEPEAIAEEAMTAAIGMYGAYAGSTGKVDKSKIAQDLQGMAAGGGPGADVAQAAMQGMQGMVAGAGGGV